MLRMPAPASGTVRSVVLRVSPALIGCIQSGDNFTYIVMLLLIVTDSNITVICWFQEHAVNYVKTIDY